MLPSFDNKLLSSFFLWFDHRLLKNGQAYNNGSGQFYESKVLYNNYYTYAIPFKQLVSDASILGANVMSGIYLSGSFISPGTSGLIDINFSQGHVYFSTKVNANAISGNFGLKEFNVEISSAPEEKIVFETKFSLKPKINVPTTGAPTDTVPYPVIFLKYTNRESVPFAFGGLDMTTRTVRAIVLADNPFNLDAVCGIFADAARTYVPLLDPSEMPFNSLGGYKNSVYNYDNLISGKIPSSGVFIKNVSISNLNIGRLNIEIMTLNPEIFLAFIDFDLEAARYIRS